jgi:hypothetical protein
VRNHIKLRAFELADELAVMTYRATNDFPKEEVYGLTSCDLKMVEAEKVLGALLRSMRNT